MSIPSPTKKKILGGQQENSGSFRRILGWKRNKSIKHVYKYLFSHLKARESILNIFYQWRVKEFNWELMNLYQVNFALSSCCLLSLYIFLKAVTTLINDYFVPNTADFFSTFSFILTTACAWGDVLAIWQVKNLHLHKLTCPKIYKALRQWGWDWNPRLTECRVQVLTTGSVNPDSFVFPFCDASGWLNLWLSRGIHFKDQTLPATGLDEEPGRLPRWCSYGLET